MIYAAPWPAGSSGLVVSLLEDPSATSPIYPLPPVKWVSAHNRQPRRN